MEGFETKTMQQFFVDNSPGSFDHVPIMINTSIVFVYKSGIAVSPRLD